MINGAIEVVCVCARNRVENGAIAALDHLEATFVGSIVQTARHVIRKIKGAKKTEREKRRGEEKERTVRTKEERIYVTVDERAAVYI